MTSAREHWHLSNQEAVSVGGLAYHRSLVGCGSDIAAENQTLVELAQVMVQAPHTLLQCLVDAALQLCHADTAGISLLEAGSDGDIFRWVAFAGQLASAVGGTTPRDLVRAELA